MKAKFIAIFPAAAILSILIINCSPKKGGESKVDQDAYKLEIDAWHRNRVLDLQGPSGWLNVAGLFWLKEGINRFGSDPGNDFVFPDGKIAKLAGSFFLKQGIVSMNVFGDVVVAINGRPVATAELFNPDSSRAIKVTSGSLEWFIIKRDSKFGVRLRDFSNPELGKFRGIDRYEVDAAFRVTARFEKTEGRTISITNVLGQTTDQPAPGRLVFSIDDTEYRLDALDEGGEELFIIFGDDTNTRETYGAGRYLYVKKPDEQSMIVIDFNKAYNPPCAFTAYATCPLPPKQNILPVAIRAGEKNYSNH